eukprot:c15771_g1_i3 orf=528-1415(-)
MADAPARALIIYGDGLAPALSSAHSHLHHLANSGVCGFLALRQLPAQVTEGERIVFELAQLLGVHDAYTREARLADCFYEISERADVPKTIPSISERFMGMKAAMVSNVIPAANLGARSGFAVTSLQDIEVVNEDVKRETCFCELKSKLPNVSTTASRLFEMLGLNGTVAKGTSSFELVFLHIGGSSEIERNYSSGPVTMEEELNWIDALVGQVKSLAQPGTLAASHLYLALVLGYGASTTRKVEREICFQAHSIVPSELPPAIAAFRPKQTHRFKDGIFIKDIRASDGCCYTTG